MVHSPAYKPANVRNTQTAQYVPFILVPRGVTSRSTVGSDDCGSPVLVLVSAIILVGGKRCKWEKFWFFVLGGFGWFSAIELAKHICASHGVHSTPILL